MALEEELKYCNSSVCFVLATANSNLFVFCPGKIPGPGQPSNSSQARRRVEDADVARASRVLGIDLARHFSSRIIDKIKAC